MSELVSAIANLCKCLESLNQVSVKPDFFRLSMLNKLNNKQILQFWDILHKLCCFSETPCKGDSYKCVENFIRTQKGVVSYFLSPNATARQLLLSFGWLLSQGIIENNIDKLLLKTPLSKELPFTSDVPADSDDLLTPDTNNPRALLNYALLLSGKIQHNLRAIANYGQEKAQLFAKIHKATVGFQGLPHLSVGDVQMLMKPELQSEFIHRCNSFIPLLQAYLRWQRKSHYFWEWMDSVLKEEESEKVNKSPSVSDITRLHEFLRRVKKSEKEPSIVNNTKPASVDSLHITTRRMCRSDNGDDLNYIIKKIDSEISELMTENEQRNQETQLKFSHLGNGAISFNDILNTLCGVTKRENIMVSKPDFSSYLAQNLKELSMDKTKCD